MSAISFIDLEASGLSPQSWPIEVGWCSLIGDPVSFLIQPNETWPRDAWDCDAEALHGISMDEIEKHGLDAGLVCERLNAALAGRTVFSDAPDWDGFWLYRLFQAAKMSQEFELADFNSIFVDHDTAYVDALIKEAAKRAPHTHRAKDDVLHMRELHQLAARAH